MTLPALTVSLLLLTAAKLTCQREPVSPAPAVLPEPTLDAQCDLRAEVIRRRDPERINVVTASPFVVAGDLSPEQLQRYLDKTVLPAARALWTEFVTARPRRPIIILLFGDERSYRHYARQWYGDTDVPFFGYFRQNQNTLVMNIDTGGGTLVHELTHALTAVDFPDIPVWFDEGFASLFEASLIGDGTIRGCVNWRLPELQAAIRENRLRSLPGLFTASDFRGEARSLNYAHARYFCMYLQERGLLASLYRSFRDGMKQDPTGTRFVAALFPNRPLGQVDRAFRTWVLSLKYPP